MGLLGMAAKGPSPTRRLLSQPHLAISSLVASVALIHCFLNTRRWLTSPSPSPRQQSRDMSQPKSGRTYTDDRTQRESSQVHSPPLLPQLVVLWSEVCLGEGDAIIISCDYELYSTDRYSISLFGNTLKSGLQA
ncbi:hypothetical protein ZEAMMB73_Zm00001d014261 [Zea mays]|uniref:Uncharacterized protein n=1 Tax=Zea mays TaxID=4577 RepID=A0A1D6GRI2_MAIZE|nr:hypothetical protein ZEAMMB73_Zm00001d014261 [Zea mays]